MLIQDDFKYSIIVDEDIAVSNIKIPALLIQPYVENAFKHGLRHKHGKKELHVHFKLNSDTNCLVVSISDNGIGRKASAQLNATTKNTHQSFATDATSKRIALLNSNKKDIVSVQISDNIVDNIALGTSVTLTISLNDK
jgi:sensor histidine kinase YesM